MNENYKDSSVEDIEPSSHDREISIFDLLKILYSYKVFIVSFVFTAALGSIIYSLTVTPLYKAEVLLFPAEENHTGGLRGSSMGSSLQFLVPELSSYGDEVSKNLSVLESYTFLHKFIEEKEILTLLFYEDWDHANNSWKEDKPSSSKAVRKLRSIIDNEIEAATGIIRASLVWHDKELAAKWLNELISELNNHIRISDIEDTRLSLEYIQKEIGQTSLKIPQNVHLFWPTSYRILLGTDSASYLLQIFLQVLPNCYISYFANNLFSSFSNCYCTDA